MANNNNYLELLLSLGVDNESSRRNINEYIKQLKNLEKVKVELEVDGMSSANKDLSATTKVIEDLQEQVKQLKGELKGLGSGASIGVDGIENFKKEIGQSIKSIGDLEKRVKDFNGTISLNYQNVKMPNGMDEKVLKSINASMTDVDGTIKNLTFKPVLDNDGFITGLNEIRENIKKIDFKDFDNKAEKTVQLIRELGRQGNLSADDLSGFESRLENLKVDKSVSDLERLNTELKEMNKELSHEAKMDNSMANINKQAQDLAQTLNKLNNVDGLNKLQISQYVNELERLSSVDIKTDSQLKEVNSDFKSVEDGIKSLVKEANRLSKVDNEIEKLQTTIEKLRSQGSLSSSQANQFLLDTKEIEKTTEAVKKLENQINKTANETTSTNKIKNAMDGISPTIDRLNEKLDLTVKKLGGNVDASALEKIKKEILEISNTNINTTNEIAKLNNQISQTEKSITQLSVSANHMGRFEDYVRKTEKALIDLERSGYATEDTINEFKNTLKNIPTGDLAKVKELLNQIDDEMDDIAHNNSIVKSIQGLNNDLLKLDAQFEKTKNLYKRTFDRAEADKVANAIEEIKKRLEGLPENVNLIKQKDLNELSSVLSQANTQVKQFNANATTSVRNSVGLVEALRTAYTKFPIWMIASTSFYSTIRGIQDLVDKVLILDKAITDLARVSSADQFELDQVISKANDNVMELSGNLEEYMTLVTEFARTGKSISESFDLADTTQMLMNISELTADESVNALTAAMISYNMTAEESIRIADKLNEVNMCLLM